MELAETALVADSSCEAPSWPEQEHVVRHRAQRPAASGFTPSRAAPGEVSGSRERFVTAARVRRRMERI
jgi:hypothetical protein